MEKFQIAPITFFVLLSISCTGFSGDSTNKGSDPLISTSIAVGPANASQLQEHQKTHEFKDAKTGLTVFGIDYPVSWKVVSRPTYKTDNNFPFFQYQIQGPNGLIAFNGPNHHYISYSNPQMEYLSRINGTTNHRPLLPIQQLIFQDVEPRMRQQGFSYVETRELPAMEQQFKQKVAENALAPDYAELFATVWSNDLGQRSLIVVRRINYRRPLSQYGFYDVWFYTVDQLIADTDSFEAIVEDTIKAQLTFRENPQWKNYSNQIIAQRTQGLIKQSAIAREENRALMDASKKSHEIVMKTLNQTQDDNHTAFMSRTFGSGSTSSGNDTGDGQGGFLNMIKEEETVFNPGDGKYHQIESGAKNTWMDSDGNYIKSNDLFYDPNADRSINQGNWSKVWEDH